MDIRATVYSELSKFVGNRRFDDSTQIKSLCGTIDSLASFSVLLEHELKITIPAKAIMDWQVVQDAVVSCKLISLSNANKKGA